MFGFEPGCNNLQRWYQHQVDCLEDTKMAVILHDRVHLGIAPIYWEGDRGSQNAGEYKNQRKNDCDHQLQTSNSFGERNSFPAAQQPFRPLPTADAI